jgi:hypothetical protein
MKRPRRTEQASTKEAVDFWIALGGDQDLRDAVYMWSSLGESKTSIRSTPSRSESQQVKPLSSD